MRPLSARLSPSVLLTNQSIFVDGQDVGTLDYDADRDLASQLPFYHRILRTPMVERELTRVVLPKRVTAIYVSALVIYPAHRRKGYAGMALQKLSTLYRDPFLFGVVHSLGAEAPMNTADRQSVYRELGFRVVETHMGKRGGGKTACAFWTPSMGALGKR